MEGPNACGYADVANHTKVLYPQPAPWWCSSSVAQARLVEPTFRDKMMRVEGVMEMPCAQQSARREMKEAFGGTVGTLFVHT